MRAIRSLCLFALVLLGAAGSWGLAASWSDEPSAAPAPPQEGVAAPPGTVPDASGDSNDAADSSNAFQEVVDRLMPEVARLRGLPWKRPVPAEMMSREALLAHQLADLEKEYPPEERARDDRILRRLGLLREGENIVELISAMTREMVAGFYDPRTGRTYIIEGPVGEALYPTIVHELTHALDDQHFDLDAIEEAYEEDPDRVFAGRCVFEGSAMDVQLRYEAENPHIAYAAASHSQADQGMAEGMQRVMARLPAYLLVGTLLHYRHGPQLVRFAVGDRPLADGLASLFAHAPTTSEQVLHPHRWLDPARRDLPREVQFAPQLAAALGDGWKHYYEHSVGELDLALAFDYFVGGGKGRLDLAAFGRGRAVSDEAHKAAVGWDAGRAIYFARGDEPLVVVQAFAFDSDLDAIEAQATMERVLTIRGFDLDPAETVEAGATRTFTVPAAAMLAMGSDSLGTAASSDVRRGVLLRRGRYLIVADGIAPQAFDAFQAALLETRFPQHRDDRGDRLPNEALAIADPFAQCVVVDRRRGLGLRLPSGSWEAKASVGGNPSAFASAEQGMLGVQLIVADQGMSLGAVPLVVEGQVDDFDQTKLTPTKWGPLAAWRYPLVDRGRQHIDMIVASDGVRIFIAVARAPAGMLAASYGEIETLLAGVVSLASY